MPRKATKKAAAKKTATPKSKLVFEFLSPVSVHVTITGGKVTVTKVSVDLQGVNDDSFDHAYDAKTGLVVHDVGDHLHELLYTPGSIPAIECEWVGWPTNPEFLHKS